MLSITASPSAVLKLSIASASPAAVGARCFFENTMAASRPPPSSTGVSAMPRNFARCSSNSRREGGEWSLRSRDLFATHHANAVEGSFLRSPATTAAASAYTSWSPIHDGDGRAAEEEEEEEEEEAVMTTEVAKMRRGTIRRTSPRTSLRTTRKNWKRRSSRRSRRSTAGLRRTPARSRRRKTRRRARAIAAIVAATGRATTATGFRVDRRAGATTATNAGAGA